MIGIVFRAVGPLYERRILLFIERDCIAYKDRFFLEGGRLVVENAAGGETRGKVRERQPFDSVLRFHPWSLWKNDVSLPHVRKGTDSPQAAAPFISE